MSSVEGSGLSSERVEIVQLLFPPFLTARQRAVLHEVAEQAGLPHVSQGEGDERHIAVGSRNEGCVQVRESIIGGHA